MKVSDYPRNDEINKIRQAILDLEKTHDWEAILLAKNDLLHEIRKKEEWIKENVNN